MFVKWSVLRNFSDKNDSGCTTKFKLQYNNI